MTASQRDHPAVARYRLMGVASRIITWVLRGVVLLFLFAPAVTIMVLSFSNEPRLRFPPRDWGVLQYQTLAESPYWLSAIGESFLLATPASILALAIGVPVALVVYRSRLRGRGVLIAFAYVPLVIPAVAYAVAIYTFFIQFGGVGNRVLIGLVYTTLAVPFIVIIVGAAIQRLPANLELVAMSLGATKTRAMLGITVRLLLPAIGASFVFAFIHSFDEATFINFIGGTSVRTLPRAIYLSIQTGIEPVIFPIATLLIVFTAVAMSVAMRLRSGSRRGAANREDQSVDH